MQAPRPTNPLALVSLICGIIGCLVITPIIGIITGLIALPKSRVAGGKGLAIAGIILSLLWIVGGLGAAYATYWGVNKIYAMVQESAKQPTITLINHLVDGDIQAASDMSSISVDKLQPIADQIKSYGKCTDVTIDSPNISNVNGVVTAGFSGKAVFEKATKQINVVVLVKEEGVIVQQFDVK
jgi:hypothetical protein